MIGNIKTCRGKNCYGKNQAHKIALAAMRARNRRLRVYECTFCHYYHLSSQERRHDYSK